MKSEQTLVLEVRLQVGKDSNLDRHVLTTLGEQLMKAANAGIRSLPDRMVELEEVTVRQTCEPEHDPL